MLQRCSPQSLQHPVFSPIARWKLHHYMYGQSKNIALFLHRVKFFKPSIKRNIAFSLKIHHFRGRKAPKKVHKFQKIAPSFLVNMSIIVSSSSLSPSLSSRSLSRVTNSTKNYRFRLLPSWWRTKSFPSGSDWMKASICAFLGLVRRYLYRRSHGSHGLQT